MLKIWVDDMRPAPSDEWFRARSVHDAQVAIRYWERVFSSDEILIDLDHDAGDYAKNGGDYIKLLDWLEREGIVDKGYSFHLHTMNPVGRDNMRAIIQKNGWREIR